MNLIVLNNNVLGIVKVMESIKVQSIRKTSCNDLISISQLKTHKTLTEFQVMEQARMVVSFIYAQ